MSEPSQSKLRIPVMMSDNPNPDKGILNVVKKVVRKAMKIASSEATGIEVEPLWILNCFPYPNLKLSKEIVSKFIRDLIILLQSVIQISLDSSVKPSFHGL